MKLRTITIAIALAGFAGVAAAGQSGETLQPMTVSAAGVAACTPPSDAPACGNFHRWIRANFSEREIGMLFGARSSYPDYLTGGIDRLQTRYQASVQEYILTQSVAGQSANATSVAAK